VATAFTALLAGRNPKPSATEITVAVAMGPLFNSTVIRNPTLTFTLDEGKPKWTVLDLSPRFIGNELAPTTRLTSGIAKITADEFLQILRAREIRANALGANVTFSKAQHDALRAFARKVLPAAR
jgi:hypothetical protein